MRGDKEPALTPEQAWQARAAMAMRNESDARIKEFLKSHDLKKFCIQASIDAMKGSAVWFNDRDNTTRYYAEELARKFYDFLTEE